MNLVKIREFFDPDCIKNEACHIIGCGSVGGAVAENLARCGIKNIHLYDFDKVSPHNISNQIFFQNQVGEMKTDALEEILKSINPEINIVKHNEGWNGQVLNGYVFLAPDSIEVRKEFVNKHNVAPFLKAVFDFRTLLTGAQHYAANWKSVKDRKNLLGSMDFTHDEAASETPVSACGTTLGVVSTPRIVSALGVNNFIKLVKGEEYSKFLQFDGFNCFIEGF